MGLRLLSGDEQYFKFLLTLSTHADADATTTTISSQGSKDGNSPTTI